MPVSRLRLIAVASIITALAGCDRMRTDAAADDPVREGDRQDWEFKNPPKAEWPLGYVVAGRNSYVSYNGSDLFYSKDGSEWKRADLPIYDVLTQRGRGSSSGEIHPVCGVVYANGRYLAVTGGAIYASGNGANWSLKAQASLEWGAWYGLSGLASGNGKIVAVGIGGVIMASPDGDTWSTTRLDTGWQLTSVDFGNGRFVATALGREGIWHSQNGKDWSKVTFASAAQPSESTIWNAVLFGNGRFLYVGRENRQSTDGMNWTPLGKSFSLPVFFVNDRFISLQSVDGKPAFASSEDLSSWHTTPTDLDYTPQWLAFFRDRYVTSNPDNFHRDLSADLGAWTPQPRINTRPLLDIVHADSLFVAVGDSGAVLSSVNAVDWVAAGKITDARLNAIAYGNHSFVVGGENGTILCSRDGRTWAAANSETSDPIRSLCFGNGKFICALEASHSSYLLVSEDGLAWRRVPMPDDYWGGHTIAFGNGRFVYAGGQQVFASSDGVHWEKSLPGPGIVHSVRFDGRRFLIDRFENNGPLGLEADLQLASMDGVYWRQVGFRSQHLWTALPRGKGEAYLGGNRLLWDSGDSIGVVRFPHHKEISVCHGKGMFVGVSGNGAIAVLKAPRDPALRPSPPARRKVPLASFRNKRFIGNLDHQHVIIVNLALQGKVLTGDYSYLDQKKSLTLRGTMGKGGRFSLKEYTHEGGNTGEFRGKLEDGEMIGEWLDGREENSSLLFEAEETGPEALDARFRAFIAGHQRLVGVHILKSVEGYARPDSNFGCDRMDSGWSCGGWSPKDAYDTSLLSSLRLEVKPDFTVELSIAGQTRYTLPLASNRGAYIRQAPYMSKGISIRELDTRVERQSYMLCLAKGGNSFELAGNSRFNFRTPSFIFSKSKP